MENFTLWRVIEKVLFYMQKKINVFSRSTNVFLIIFFTLIKRDHILVLADFMLNFWKF